MNVMKRAWEIAKAAVEEFGGKVREYFGQSLKQAWAEKKGTFVAVKKTVKKPLDILISDVQIMVTHFYKFAVDTLVNKKFCGFGRKRNQNEVQERTIKAGTEFYMYYSGEPIFDFGDGANGLMVRFETVQELIQNGTLVYSRRP